MNKIAVLGVPSSGKTVMLAGLGGRYERADPQGYSLVAESRETLTYVKGLLGCMRKGEWPSATSPDTLQELVWSVRQRTDGESRRIGDLTVLDFAGEVYRAAFEGGPLDGFEDEVSALREYVSGATALAVLINLSDLIKHGDEDVRVYDMVWATKKILDFAVETIGASGSGDLNHRVALVFTQSDRYAATIGKYADLQAMFVELLPMISQSYNGLDILSAHVVDGTALDDNGFETPNGGLSESGMQDFWQWLIARCGTEKVRSLASSSLAFTLLATPRRHVASLVAAILLEVRFKKLYAKGRIPPEKLENATLSMELQEPKSDVLLQFDCTVFGDAKEGLVITSKAVYAKKLWSDPFRIPLDSDFSVRRVGDDNLVFARHDPTTGVELGANEGVCLRGLGLSEVDKIVKLFNVWKEGRKQ